MTRGAARPRGRPTAEKCDELAPSYHEEFRNRQVGEYPIRSD
jgi:hypothetical protein